MIAHCLDIPVRLSDDHCFKYVSSRAIIIYNSKQLLTLVTLHLARSLVPRPHRFMFHTGRSIFLPLSIRCQFDFAVFLLGRIVPYASALNVRIRELMVNARPELEHLTVFVE